MERKTGDYGLPRRFGNIGNRPRNSGILHLSARTTGLRRRAVTSRSLGLVRELSAAWICGEPAGVICEQVTVGVAQNAGPSTDGHCSAFNLPGTYGRSFSQRNGFDPRVEGYLYGWNFQEQWDRAFQLDPELVFVTGWNEFIAGQWLPEDNWTGDPFSFVDQYDWEHSRDIEPNKGWGDRGDVYYLQLVDNVRRFKGMEALAMPSAEKTIPLGQTMEWNDVEPYYAHYKGNTGHRDHRGRYDQYYVNRTGRNDIVGAKVARDTENVYFYVQTAATLTPSNDPN